MPCDCCERGSIENCGYYPVYSYDAYTMEHDATCEGLISGTPGDYIILKCKIRLGIYWLFNDIPTDKETAWNEEEGLETWDDLSWGSPGPE